MKQILLYTFLFSCLALKGQDYQVSLKSWGVNDGLSDRQVNAIYKDTRGFIWLCTRKGLNRFDGYTFKVYTKEKDGLPFNFIARMAEDVNGSFWVVGSYRFDTNNLFIFDPLTKKVTTFQEKTGYKENIRVDFVQKTDDSTLLLGSTLDNFFFTWHPAHGLHKIPYPVEVDLVITTGENNTFWVRNKTGQLCEINLQGALLRKINTTNVAKSTQPHMGINAIYVRDSRKNNTYKLATQVHVENGIATLTNWYDNFSNVSFNTGIDSIIYFQGALHHPRKGVLVDFINEGEMALKSNVARVILDNNGRIWMCNGFGLHLLTLTKSKFRKYFYEDVKKVVNNSYRNLVVNGNKLFAVNELYGPSQTNTDTAKKMDLLPPETRTGGCYALTKASTGDVFGLTGNYLYMLRQNSRKWSYTEFQNADFTRNPWTIYEVRKDSFLLGLYNGLAWFNLSTLNFSDFKKYNRFTSLTSSTVLDIQRDNSGSQWICCSTGFYAYDSVAGITARYSSADTGAYFLPAKEFQHFLQDNDGIYWLATTSGLIRWDKGHGKYRLYTREDGLSNNNIYAVYADSSNRLWLSSDYGIMQFNKKTANVKTYLTDDGITYNEFNRASHTRDAAGNLYFGTLDGVTAFDPKDFPNDATDEKNAPLAVSSFVQFNGMTNRLEDRTAELIHTGEIILNPGDRFFTINFALLTYTDVIHNTYYWKIDGVDSGWNTMREPVLRVSGLPYGKMELHIKAQAGDGSWSRNELRFDVRVIKPIYLQAWFIIGCILVLASGTIGWYRLRIFRLKKENERLDRLVKQKTSALEETIADLKLSSQQKDVLMKEIHHRVKNNLQVISTLLDLQMAGIKDEAARTSIEEGVSRISSIALIHHHLYKGDNLSAIDLSGFTKELFQQVSAVYLKPAQKIRLVNEIPVTLFDIDTALPLGLILNELMTNSFKYAFGNIDNGIMKVDLVLKDNEYTLQYCDDGPGLPDDYRVEKAGSLGMTIIKSLAKQLGGSFSYDRAANCFIVVFMETNARRKIA